jgi:hypothetical protein
MSKALRVPINSVFEAMQSTFGSLYVNDFTLYGRNYRVNLQSEANFCQAPKDLKQVFVRSDADDMMPLRRAYRFRLFSSVRRTARFAEPLQMAAAVEQHGLSKNLGQAFIRTATVVINPLIGLRSDGACARAGSA